MLQHGEGLRHYQTEPTRYCGGAAIYLRIGDSVPIAIKRTAVSLYAFDILHICHQQNLAVCSERFRQLLAVVDARPAVPVHAEQGIGAAGNRAVIRFKLDFNVRRSIDNGFGLLAEADIRVAALSVLDVIQQIRTAVVAHVLVAETLVVRFRTSIGDCGIEAVGSSCI